MYIGKGHRLLFNVIVFAWSLQFDVLCVSAVQSESGRSSQILLLGRTSQQSVCVAYKRSILRGMGDVDIKKHSGTSVLRSLW